MRSPLLVVLALGVASCSPPDQQTAAVSAAPIAGDEAKRAPPPTDAWIGKWIGVEGNFLEIKPGVAPGVYAITEGTLDGPRELVGTNQGEVIEIEVAGKRQTIRAGDGDATGLKYLAGKTDCLVIESGRGFCR